MVSYNDKYLKKEYSRTNNCIVLDLDHCCLCTMDNPDDYYHFTNHHLVKKDTNLQERIYTIYLNNHSRLKDGLFVSRKEYLKNREEIHDEVDNFLWGIKRPYLDEFIDFCFEHFERVIVWSAGKRDYVHCIVNTLFEKRRPHYVWTYDDIYFDHHGDVVKSLDKLVKEIDDPHITMDNIIVVDDTDTTFSENPHNAIHIPAYRPGPKYTDAVYDDDSLLRIMKFFSRTGNIRNIKNINFKKIFRY